MNQEPLDQQKTITTSEPQVTPEHTEQSKKGVNPIFAISIAIVVALALAGMSLLVFLRSDTREKVGITEEATSSTEESDLSATPDETSDLSEADLDSIESDISSTATDVSSEEFGSSDLTDASLGL